MEWKAVLRGNDLDLQTLADIFREGDPGVTVEDDGTFVLQSTAFDGMEGAQEVQPAAAALLVLLNGAAKASDPSHRPVDLTGHFRSGETVHAVVLADTITVRSRLGAVVVRADGDPHPPPPPRARAWAALASTDPPVSDALRLLGSVELDYVALYKLFEIVRDDSGGSTGIVGRKWAAREDISAFTGAANRPDVSGDDARHARMPGAPPKRSFTIDESRSFVLTLVQRWLADKESSAGN